MCFQDEIKQLSSWKFFYRNRFGNRFGNDVSRLKKQEGRLGVKVRTFYDMLVLPQNSSNDF